MKPFIQRLAPDEASSFMARTFRTPDFEVGWHQHIEYELILFTEGSGISFIGNHIGEFETGDIYFLGANLPHTFQKTGGQITSAVVVQFREDFWGAGFVQIPENRALKALFETAMLGLKLHGDTRLRIAPILQELQFSSGIPRILLLLEALSAIAGSTEYQTVSTHQANAFNSKDMDMIDKTFQFTMASFQDQISLADVAKIACMSVPAFCANFKRSTKKTYVDFLNEVRIEYACGLLIDTHKPIAEICYESGYSTQANFHKQFLKVKKITPLQYRKSFASDNIRKGNNIGILV